MKFSLSFRVSAGDIDEQGHVNNVAFVRWVQEIAVAHWQNWATVEQKAKFTWVITRHEIEYKKPAFENDEITSTTWIGEIAKVTCERFTEIKRGENLLARSRTVWCMIDKSTGRPNRITEDIKSLFATIFD